jgi:hypothetical protein
MDKQLLRVRCETLLIAMLGKEDLSAKWWNSPNKAFSGATPEQIFLTSPAEVYTYLIKSAEGEW